MTTAKTVSLPKLTPKIIGGFIGSGVISLVAANFVPIFISGLTEDLGFSLGTAGLIATGLSMSSVVSMWAANLIVARHSRPTIAGVGAALMATGFGLSAVFYTSGTVPIGLIIAGLGCGAMGAASVAAISSTADPDKSTTVVALINRVAVSTMFLLAPIYFRDLQGVFAVLTVLGLLGLLLVRGLPNCPTDLLNNSKDRQSAAVEKLRCSGVVLALAFGVWSMTEDMVYSLTAAVFGVHAGLTSEVSTSILAYKVLGGLLGTIIAPFALKKLGRIASIAAIVIISTVAKFILITSQNPTVYIISLVIWGIVYLTVLVLVLGLAARMDLSGRTGVFVNSLYLVGIACGPMIGGLLQPHMSFLGYAVLDCAIAVAAGLVIVSIAIGHEGTDHNRISAVTGSN